MNILRSAKSNMAIAVAIGIPAAIIWVGLLGKQSRPSCENYQRSALQHWWEAPFVSTGKPSPTYEITLPDGIYTLVAPHELSDKELNGWLKGACTVISCPVKYFEGRP
jgi:hypothetical protein